MQGYKMIQPLPCSPMTSGDQAVAGSLQCGVRAVVQQRWLWRDSWNGMLATQQVSEERNLPAADSFFSFLQVL